MRVVLAVCGGRSETVDAPFSMVDEVGQFLASLSEVDLVYGACPGYPDRLVSAFLMKGSPDRVYGFSPHRGPLPGWPNPSGVSIEYTGLGSGRNRLILERATDASVWPGDWGTVSEACWAFSRALPIISPHFFADKLNRWLRKGSLPMDSWEKIANACIARKADGVPFSDQALLSLVDSYSGRSSPGNPVDSLWEPSSLLSWLERAPQQQ